jgi:oligopeptide/dipeptide ABC transporter ATP-binding protein
MSEDLLLEIKGLKTQFFLDEGLVEAVNGVDLKIKRGSTLGLVGESGCGKSVTAFSILNLVIRPGRVVAGEILFHRAVANAANGGAQVETIDLAKLDPDGRQMSAVRGKEIAMIFQEPMVSLSMMHTIGYQIEEAILLHFDVTQKEAHQRAITILQKVGIPNAAERVDAYPFQLSGGMRQRAMIAMALSCNPTLLIADEPTTALDVTTQAQILELMIHLQKEFGMSILLITHDLGVVAETCDEVAVMYLGQVVEQGSVRQIFHSPAHPYTQALLNSIPKLGSSKAGRLNPIEGSVPDPYNRPSGCPFNPRCVRFINNLCDQVNPPQIELNDGRSVRCWLHDPNKGAQA